MAALLAWVCAIRLSRAVWSQRRQPFEVAFEIGVIELDEIAALKRIGASLDLRAEDFEIEADPGRHLDVRDRQCVRTAWSGPTPRDLRRQFVTLKRWIAFACPLEHLKRLLEIAAGGAFGKMFLGAEDRHLLRNGDVDELIHCHALGVRHLPGLFHQ